MKAAWVEEARARGQRLVSLAFPRRSAPWLLPGTKSVSYATHVAAEAEARRRGADDAVLVDLDGTVLEGTVTNVWWREGATLVTPELELGILAGETRAAWRYISGQAGFSRWRWLRHTLAGPGRRLECRTEVGSRCAGSAVRGTGGRIGSVCVAYQQR